MVSVPREIYRSAEGFEAPRSQGATTKVYWTYFDEEQRSEPGWIGGRSGEGFTRISTFNNRERVQEALARIRAVL